MIGDKLLGCFEAGFSGPITVNNRPKGETRCLQFLFPTNITKFGCPPGNGPAEMGDFPVTELKQMTSRLARAGLLVDEDRRTLEPEIRIDGYQRHIYRKVAGIIPNLTVREN